MKTILSVAIGILLLAGCTKYENGPEYSLITSKERLTNNWMINEAIHVNGEAPSFLDTYRDYQFNIGDDEKYTQFYRNSDEQHIIKKGVWKFTNDKLHFVATADDGSEIDYQILRLAGNELWVRFTDSGNEWELHLHPK